MPALINTVIMTLLSLLLAVPIGIFSAIFLAEYAGTVSYTHLDVYKRQFMEKLLGNTARPLKELTGDIHFHTIEAESDRILDLVEEGLKEKQFLIS